MSDFISILLSSFPPIIAPLAFLLLLFRLLSTLNPFQPGQKITLRRFLVVVWWILLPFYMTAAIDELYNGSKLLTFHSSEPSFSSEVLSRPVLPPTISSKYKEVRSILVEEQQQQNGSKIVKASTKEWALVTGASSGIGRSIAVQLARRNIPLVLVARDRRDNEGKSDLDQLAQDLRQCYGTDIAILRADLSLPGEARRIHTATSSAGIFVSYLILNAGYAPTALHIDLSKTDDIERSLMINVQSTSLLASLFGADMQEHVATMRRTNQLSSSTNSGTTTPRILFVSSITGNVPGLVGAANYGATKAYLSSLARALTIEMESMGIGVTLLHPGATRTNFAKAGGMEDASCWDIPLLSMDPDDVADRGIKAMFRGAKEYIQPGILNMIYVRVLGPIFPTRFALRFAEFAWAPLPSIFEIFSSKRKEPSDVCIETEKKVSSKNKLGSRQDVPSIDFSTLQNRCLSIEHV